MFIKEILGHHRNFNNSSVYVHMFVTPCMSILLCVHVAQKECYQDIVFFHLTVSLFSLKISAKTLGILFQTLQQQSRQIPIESHQVLNKNSCPEVTQNNLLKRNFYDGENFNFSLQLTTNYSSSVKATCMISKI